MEMPTLSTVTTQTFLDWEDKLVRQVLDSYLGRPVTKTDMKRVSRVYQEGQPDKYLLKIDNEDLGIVRFCIDTTDCEISCKVEFRVISTAL